MGSVICLHDCAHCGFEQEVKLKINPKSWPKSELALEHACIVCEKKYRIRVKKRLSGKISWRISKIGSE